MAVFQAQSRSFLALHLLFLLIVPVTALLYVVSCTLSNCHRQRFHQKHGVHDRYEDEDGVASDESLRRRYHLTPIRLLVVAASVGLVAVVWNGSLMFSNSSASAQDRMEFGASIVVWTANLMSTVLFVAMPESPVRYRCGLACASGHLITCTSSMLQGYSIISNQNSDLRSQDSRILFINLAQIVASFSACIGSLSVPRRPDVRQDGNPVDRFHTASALNRWTLAWAKGVLSIARTNGQLRAKDLPTLHQRARSDFLLNHSGLETSESPLWKALARSYWQPLLTQSLLGAVQPFLQFAPVLLLLMLLRKLEGDSSGNNSGSPSVVLIVALGISLTLTAWIDVWLRWLACADLALRIRSEVSALLYVKATKRTDLTWNESQPPCQGSLNDGSDLTTDRSSTVPGQADQDSEPTQAPQKPINLLAIDIQRLFDFMQFHYLLLQSSLSLLFSTGFLWALLGWQPVVAGLAMFLLILPFNVWSSRKSTAAQVRLMGIKDQKLTTLTETLRGIRQIKISAQQEQCQARLGLIRGAELGVQWLVFCYETVLIGCYNFGPIALSAAALTAYAIIHGELSASVAFTSITVFSIMESSLAVIPQYMVFGIQAWISLARIERFLKSPEKEHYLTEDSQIAFEKATLSWQWVNDPAKTQDFILSDVDLSIPDKGLTIVCGSTGSGKSLLLASLAGEASLLSGRVRAPRKAPHENSLDLPPQAADWIIDSAMAFVAQTPWLENATIRDNILFGLPYQQGRYDNVINHCALEHDIRALPDGDLTDLGHDGVNLSGGQKWRVSFARALYSRAGILIIDDLFSAVDASVSRQLLENAILGELGSNRTRILVTHHTDLCISRAELVVVLDKGRVLYSAAPEGWQNRQFAERTVDCHAESAVDANSEGQEGWQGSNPSEVVDDDIEPLEKIVPKKFLEEEAKYQGSVSFEAYLTYFRSSGGIIYWLPILALFIAHQALLLGRSWFVGYWTHSSSTKDTNKAVQSGQTAIDSEHRSRVGSGSLNYYIGVYVGLSLCLCITGALRYFVIYRRSIRASRTMFANLVFSILRAPLRWLDTVPMGRILNRFSTDLEMIDSQLGTQLGAMIYCMLQILGEIVAATFVSPWILVVVIVLFVACAIINTWYLTGAREVKRLEAIARSPMFETFGSTLSGIATIRTYDCTEIYISRMLQRIDNHARALWFLWLFNGWVTLRLNIVGAMFTMAIAVFVLYSGVDASLAGFALSFVLQYSSSICLLTSLYSNVELAMNSVERVSEYINLPIEDHNTFTVEVPAFWPWKGHVEVSGLIAGYSPELCPILNDLTFAIDPNERVGIIGRTGAGKSSLALALLRFLDVRAGSIFIDGVDVAHVPLPILRSRLTMIPQDPILFYGTVRSNLDSFGTHDDTELLQALRRVNISSAPGSQNLTLDTTVAECGLNLSQGQRQLLCLARAIVRRPKILILDEATSAIDFTTDSFIQKSIRSDFTSSTLIVIAHRLSTVVDFDKVLVMEDGRAIEFGRPKDLLLKTGGTAIFKDMVDNSGDREKLRNIILGQNPSTTI